MNSTTTTATILLLVAFSSGAFAQLGNCNRSFLTHGVVLCQRNAIDSLALNKDLTCDSAYTKQISCVDNHVHKCLQDTLWMGFKQMLIDLLKFIIFNCGTHSGQANSFVVQQLGCKDGSAVHFSKAADCWKDFVSKIKTNRNDPTLCRTLADAKRCVTNITNHYCPNVQLETDNCNPFCSNHTDDHRECPVPTISPTCKTDFYYEKEKECERTFINDLTQYSNKSCGTEVPKLKSCVENQYKGKCFTPMVSDSLLQKLSNGILGVTKGQRLFCNAMDVTVLPDNLRDIIPCERVFFEEAEKCSSEFREKFLQNKNDKSLCSVYDAAKSCHHKAQQDYCHFNQSVLQITHDNYNPFCSFTFTLPLKTTERSGCGMLSMYFGCYIWIISVLSFISKL